MSRLATHAPSMDRIIIAVRDLRMAVRFYTQVLGFAVEKYRRRADYLVTASLSAGPLRVVLVQGLDAESSCFQFLNTFGPGVHHLRVGVKDLPRLAEDLKAAGMAFGPEWRESGRLLTPRDECSGMQFAFIERGEDDPSGASLPSNLERGPWPSVVEPSKSA